jgi:hypothetical protein
MEDSSKGGNDRWGSRVYQWLTQPLPAPSLRTHGIIGFVVSILHMAVGVALSIGLVVIVGVALITYFRGSCSTLNYCLSQAPFSDWFLPFLFILWTLEYIERAIVSLRKRDSAAS